MQQRIKTSLGRAFGAAHRGSGPEFYLSAPGRINLIGEQTGYNDFPVLPIAIARAIRMAVRPRTDRRIVLRDAQAYLYPERSFELGTDVEPYGRENRADYAKGPVQSLARVVRRQRGRPGDLRGMDCLVEGDIPPAAGLAFGAVNNLGLHRHKMAERMAEAGHYVGTRGGGMDQAAGRPAGRAELCAARQAQVNSTLSMAQRCRMREKAVIVLLVAVLAVVAAVFYLCTGRAEAPGGADLWSAVAEGNLSAAAALLADQPEVAETYNVRGETPLHVAAAGAPDLVRLLLLSGAEANVANEIFATPLHVSARQGEIECTRLLLEAGADPSRADMFAQSPMQRALNYNRQDVARLLLAHGAEHTVHTAAGFGDMEALQRILEENPKEVNHTSTGARKPLHWAAFYGRTEAARFLVENGARLFARDGTEATPLQLAALRGHEEVARILLEAGAEEDAFAAAGLGHLQVLKEIAREDAGELERRRLRPGPPLIPAAANGHLKVAQWLIEQGADPAEEWREGLTALHAAAAGGHAAVAEFLLGEGVAVDEPALNGRTPLHEAAAGGHSAVVELLLGAGADPGAEDRAGATPLHAAAWEGKPAVVAALVQGGARLNARDSRERTPLHLAVYRGRAGMARVLVENGADIAAREQHGWTPLHLAAWTGRAGIAETLLGAGADIGAADRFGAQPLHMAARAGHTDTVRQLLESGAEVGVPDDEGYTPLALARLLERPEIARMLRDAGATE